MPRELIAGLGPNLVLRGGYRLRITALNPTTGLVVPNVTVSDVSLQVDQRDADDAVATEPPAYVPLFTYGGT